MTNTMTKNQKKHFTNLKKLVDATGQYLPAVDDIGLEHAAILLDMIDTAKEQVAEHIQVFPTGARQIAPEVNNLRGLLADFSKMADKLGLSPAARKKMGVEVKKEKPKSALMAMRRKAL